MSDFPAFIVDGSVYVIDVFPLSILIGSEICVPLTSTIIFPRFTSPVSSRIVMFAVSSPSTFGVFVFIVIVAVLFFILNVLVAFDGLYTGVCFVCIVKLYSPAIYYL